MDMRGVWKGEYGDVPPPKAAPGPPFLGKAIAAARSSRGITQTRLAFMLGVEQPRLSKIESGSHGYCSERIFLAACSAMGMSPAEVLSFYEEKNPRSDESPAGTLR